MTNLELGMSNLETRRLIGRLFQPSFLLCQLFFITGCQTYQLQGVVLDGSVAAIIVVNRTDPRLEQPGVPDATVDLTLDPSTLKPIHVGTTTTDEEGRFGIEVDQSGAGFLEYEAGVLCHVKGYGTVYQTLPLPHDDKRLLIIVGPGKSGQPQPDDVLQETLEIGRQLTQ